MGRRGAATVVALVVGVVVALVPGALPAGAQAAPEGPVWLAVEGDAGEHISGGATRTFTPEDADFRTYTYSRDVEVVVAGAETWRIAFVRPSASTQLTLGRHPVVAQPDRGPTDAGLAINAEGRGCGRDDVSGWIEVDDIAYSDGAVSRLSIRFEHTCTPDDGPGGGTLRGEVRWDGSAPLPTNHIPPSPIPPSFPSPPASVPADRDLMWFTRPWATGPDGQPFTTSSPVDRVERRTSESGVEIEAAATFPVETIFLVVKMRLQLSSRQPTLLPGLYEDLLSVRENPVLGGFSLEPGGGGTCLDGTGGADVAVDEVDPAEDGYDDLAVRWVVSCPGVGVTEQGLVRWQRPAPVGAPVAPTAVTAAAGVDSTVVSWTPPTTGPTPTGYVVTTFVDGLAVETATTAPSGATSVVVPTPDEGLHTFKVAAVGAAGTGRRSVASAPVAVPGPDLGPFASIAALVRQQHVDLAGRQPTAAELTAMGRALARGEVTPQEVVRDLRGRATISRRRASLARLYRASFGRTPDTAGLTYWMQRMAGGTSLTRVADSFVASAELRRLYGSLGDAAFVDRVYQNVLGRAADASGRAFWVARLQQGWTRGRVLVSFSESSEHVLRTAAEVEAVTTYVALLRRVPTAAELTATAPAASRSTASAVLVRSLLARPEYARRFG